MRRQGAISIYDRHCYYMTMFNKQHQIDDDDDNAANAHTQHEWRPPPLPFLLPYIMRGPRTLLIADY